MPFVIEQREMVIDVMLYGALSMEELSNLGDALDGIDRDTPGLNRLVDASQAIDSGELNFNAMARFADERCRSSPARNVRTAIVASTGVVFGFARMFQGLHEQPITLEVFGRRPEALEWLGIEGVPAFRDEAVVA